MKNELESSSVVKWAARIFILISASALLIIGKNLFVPIVIAIFFTFLLYPISQKLEKYKFPKVLAVILSILFAMILFAGIVYFFMNQINSFREDIPMLSSEALNKGNRILEWVETKTQIAKNIQIEWIQEKIKDAVSYGPELMLGLFSTTGTFLAMFALVPLYIFFLTYFRDKYKMFIILVAKNNHKNVLDIIKKTSRVSVKYLKGLMIDVLILSVLGSIGYLLLGIKHAILFGVLAALLNIVPYVGVLVGSLLPIMMAIITKDEIGYAIGALGVALVVQFIDNNFISPYVIGSSVSINPLTAMIVLIVGAMMWGVAGMILSMPLAGMMKVVFDNIEPLKPWGYLIGEEVNYQEKGFFRSKKG
jgi:predicted PurR-regulated permease PerM